MNERVASVGVWMEKLESSCAAGGMVKGPGSFGKQHVAVLQESDIEAPWDPAATLLVHTQEKWKYTST